ncbi:trypsin-like peptidase domain-containing protein [Skermania sp. ID1734]|uniref:S1 family peptidase n=1 Tax=Skermania sp. ID1734 TaxID=2597516 RepID=UPI00117F3EA1|nr:S1 family peptidase [Skermania sp. ID1734]TSE00295.1 trypsin-like peptidase domain-containing protein [Skermania sp. ID1734]
MFKKLATMVMAVGAASALVGVGGAAAAPAPSTLGGGSGIIIDDEFECTLTTIGHDGAGNLVGLTAGHCGDAGAVVKAEYNREVVGRFVYSNHDLDYAVIRFDPAAVIPVNHVGHVTITGMGNPAQFGNVVCKEGRTTGNTCGIVWGDVFNTNQETWSQVCVVEGDSGSPVVIGSTLVGMVNAYLATPCIGPEVGTNINAVLGDMNARGGVGSGYRPI